MTDFEIFDEALSYDPETGILTWRVDHGRWGRIKAGSEAGWIARFSTTSYRHICVSGIRRAAHQIAWLLMTGDWPQHQIDHIDGNGLNNRFCNLRDVTQSENMRNARRLSNNTSGVNGVHFDRDTGKWCARIFLDGKTRFLGYFENIEDAANARKSANKKFGYTARHGTRAS